MEYGEENEEEYGEEEEAIAEEEVVLSSPRQDTRSFSIRNFTVSSIILNIIGLP